MNCEKKYGIVKDKKKAKTDIEKFCKSLTANKVKESKDIFLDLPQTIQCLFLHYSWDILSHKNKHSEDSYSTAFKLFKLFRGKEMKDRTIYSKYKKLKTLEKYYKKALEWNRKNGKESKSESPKSKKDSKTESSSKSESPKSKKSSSKKDRKAESSSKSRSPKTKYDKEYQKKPSPEDELDPLFLFYNSLYKEKSDSKLAVNWLTEHGVYEGEKRNKLISKYKKINNLD
jgi:hypothetical protein